MAESDIQRFTCYPGTRQAYDLAWGDAGVVGNGVWEQVPADIVRLCSKKGRLGRVVILTDANVNRIFGELFVGIFEAAGITPLLREVEAGEHSKCRETKAAIEDWMLAQHCYRDTVVVALGGGVVGDLAGFVAATYMRGVHFVQVPTTALAMFDSSIGGKTGIDTPTGKNLVGAFKQPKGVYADLRALGTLPMRELRNGLVEAIKHAALVSNELFELFEANVAKVLAKDMSVLAPIVFESMRIKGDIVTKDEKEGGLRATLNLGHTIGHGIEAHMQPAMLHGECVAVGLVKGAEVARAMGLCSAATVGRLQRCLSAYGLSLGMPPGLEVEQVMHAMQFDKKNVAGAINCVLLRAIGEVARPPSGKFFYTIEPRLLRRVLAPAVRVVPGAVRSGEGFTVPGSKSLSNRLLLLAGLADGTCRLGGLLHSDDTQVMMSALEALGASFGWEDGGQTLVVTGRFKAPTKPLYMSNAGTATRFLQSVLALVGREDPDAAPPATALTGSERMLARPQGPLVAALRRHGVRIDYEGVEGHLPLTVHGGGLKGGVFPIEGKVSSQFVSSVLLAAPYASGPLTIELAEAKPTSISYIEMTVETMRLFGVAVERLALNKFRVPTAVYRSPPRVQVECDASSATYPLAMAAVSGGSVTVHGVGSSSLQGDADFAQLLGQMGCAVSRTETTTTVTGPAGGGGLVAVDVDMADMTDAFMTAVAVAVFAKGTTRISGIANQHVKECDRIAAMVAELAKMGVTARDMPDGIEVDGLGGTGSAPSAAHIECYDDHRIAMSFAVVGSVVEGVVITDKECTAKTYPNFWDDVEAGLGLSVLGDGGAPAGQLGAAARRSASLVLIGMRGAGKSTLGKAAAASLGWAFLDLDDVLEAEQASSCKAIVDAHGWEHFRQVEEQVLRRALEKHPTETVIACGGGVVESAGACERLKEHWPVLHIQRDIEDILTYLHPPSADADADAVAADGEAAGSARRPNYGESTRAVWDRRLPRFRACSTHDFGVDEPGSAAFCAFVRRVQAATAPRRFCLFGTPIKASPSPTMHNAGFRHLGLPHHYDLCETDDPAAMRAVVEAADFGGASVTIPLKEKVGALLQELSPAATAIGAVNTICRLPNGKLRGDNTDWIGIRRSLECAAPGGTQWRGRQALVIGAGGTARAACFCAREMGMKIWVHNRTLAKAEVLAREFGGEAVPQLTPQTAGLRGVSVVLCTVPASAEFELPQLDGGWSEMFGRCGKAGPLVLDAAYKPRSTRLLRQAKASGWAYIEGVDMLVHQGLAQLSIWSRMELSPGVAAAFEAAARGFYDKLSATW